MEGRGRESLERSQDKSEVIPLISFCRGVKYPHHAVYLSKVVKWSTSPICSPLVYLLFSLLKET